MTVLLDTCIVIDLLQDRAPHANVARTLFRAIASEQVKACITSKSVTDIYYLVHKSTHSDKETRGTLNKLLTLVSMIDTTADDVFLALTSPVTDFEDAVLIESAVRSHVDYIITRNLKDFTKSQIPVLSPSQLLKKLEP